MAAFSFIMKTFLVILILVSSSISFGQKTDKLNEIIDRWHSYASSADFDAYFCLMNDEFVFLGTAPGERWNKQEFASFCKPYFDRGDAWDFKPSNRNWKFSKNGKVAWFDEDLDTWMKGCRGAGILVKEKGQWKLAYYNLTVLIENEKIQEFIDLRSN